MRFTTLGHPAWIAAEPPVRRKDLAQRNRWPRTRLSRGVVQAGALGETGCPVAPFQHSCNSAGVGDDPWPCT